MEKYIQKIIIKCNCRDKHYLALINLSLTLVTFFFETSKPQANIYYALVGLECQA
jgi:hypothetical protein